MCGVVVVEFFCSYEGCVWFFIVELEFWVWLGCCVVLFGGVLYEEVSFGLRGFGERRVRWRDDGGGM